MVFALAGAAAVAIMIDTGAGTAIAAVIGLRTALMIRVLALAVTGAGTTTLHGVALTTTTAAIGLTTTLTPTITATALARAAAAATMIQQDARTAIRVVIGRTGTVLKRPIKFQRKQTRRWPKMEGLQHELHGPELQAEMPTDLGVHFVRPPWAWWPSRCAGWLA